MDISVLALDNNPRDVGESIIQLRNYFGTKYTQRIQIQWRSWFLLESINIIKKQENIQPCLSVFIFLSDPSKLFCSGLCVAQTLFHRSHIQ